MKVPRTTSSRIISDNIAPSWNGWDTWINDEIMTIIESVAIQSEEETSKTIHQALYDHI